MDAITSPTYGYLSDKTDLLKRLARIKGQVEGLARMVEDERYCIDILTQLSAAETALRTVGLHLLDTHVRSCVVRALQSGSPTESETKTNELLEAVARFSKTR